MGKKKKKSRADIIFFEKAPSICSQCLPAHWTKWKQLVEGKGDQTFLVGLPEDAMLRMQSFGCIPAHTDEASSLAHMSEKEAAAQIHPNPYISSHSSY